MFKNSLKIVKKITKKITKKIVKKLQKIVKNTFWMDCRRRSCVWQVPAVVRPGEVVPGGVVFVLVAAVVVHHRVVGILGLNIRN